MVAEVRKKTIDKREVLEIRDVEVQIRISD
jgi:hypothetical protein